MTDFMRDEPSAPAVVDRGTFQAELDALRVREGESTSLPVTAGVALLAPERASSASKSERDICTFPTWSPVSARCVVSSLLHARGDFL